MSISCRTDPCWVLWADRQARDRTSDPLPHYPDRETVIEVLDARTGLDRVDVEFLASCQYRLPTPCLTVSCDSCGAGPNNDADERTTHFADLAQARAYLDGWGWDNGAPVRCRWCRAQHADWATTIVVPSPVAC